MSWSRRSLIGALAALPACGFTPVYGPGGAARGLSGQIAVDPPRDEAGYLLVRTLEERLGRAPAAPYRLAAEIDIEDEGFGITPDRDTTRIRLTGTLAYRLIGPDGAIRQSGELTNFASYSAPVISARRRTIAGNPVTIRAAERDAVERLMTILADQLVSRLLATAPDWRV